MTHGAPAVKKAKSADGTQEILAIPPPDGGWGWMVVFASFMIHVIADGVTYTFGILFVEFLDYFGESKGATAWIASILVGMTLGSGPIASAFVNKYGCRAVTIAGAVLAAAGLGVSVFATNVLTLYFTVGIMAGLGFGLIYLPAIVCVSVYFEKKRAFATGIAVCGSGLGTFIFAPLTDALVKEYGWKGAMLIISGLTLNCVIFGAMFRPLEPPKKPRGVSTLALEAGEAQKLIEMKERSQRNQVNGSGSNPNVNRLSYPGSGAQQNGAMPPPVSKQLLSVTSSDVARMARSQPQLLEVPGSPQHERFLYGSQGVFPTSTLAKSGSVVSNHSRQSQEQGVMYRKDILYTGSVQKLPEYKSNPVLYTGSVLRIPQIEDEEDTNVCGCIPCSKEGKDAYREMMDFSLLKDGIFLLFALSNFCTSIGFNVPYVYITDRALDLGMESENASFLLAVIGIANTVGRVVLGYVSDKPWLNRLWLYNSALTVCGLATMFSAFCIDYPSLIFYSAVFGATIGAYVGLTSVILADLFGLEKLTNAFGLLLLFQGVASLIGPPIAGWLYDALGSYDPGFYVAGGMIAISGIMLFLIPCVQRIQRRSTAKYQVEEPIKS